MKNYLEIDEDVDKEKIVDTLLKAGVTIVTSSIGGPAAAAAILGHSLTTTVMNVIRRNSSLFHNEKQKSCRNKLIEAMVEKAGHYENTNRSSSTTDKEAEEIFEDLYLRCEKESEEQKIKYMGNLAVNFHNNPEGCPVHLVHQFIKDLEEFTYNQLCVLSVIHRHGTPPDPISILYKRPIDVNMDDDLQYDLYLLEQKGYIGKDSRTTAIGKKFVNLTHLYEVLFEEVNPIAKKMGLKRYGHDTCKISKKQYAIWTHDTGASSEVMRREPEPNDEWVAAYWVFSPTGYSYHQVSDPNKSFRLAEATQKLRPQITEVKNDSGNAIPRIRSEGIEITIPNILQYDRIEFNSQNTWLYKGSLYANVRTSQHIGLYALLYPKGVFNPQYLREEEEGFATRLTDCFLKGAKIF